MLLALKSPTDANNSGATILIEADFCVAPVAVERLVVDIGFPRLLLLLLPPPAQPLAVVLGPVLGPIAVLEGVPIIDVSGPSPEICAGNHHMSDPPVHPSSEKVHFTKNTYPGVCTHDELICLLTKEATWSGEDTKDTGMQPPVVSPTKSGRQQKNPN